MVFSEILFFFICVYINGRMYEQPKLGMEPSIRILSAGNTMVKGVAFSTGRAIIYGMTPTFPMINAICEFFESLRNTGVSEDVAVRLCSTDFAHTYDIPMKEARGIVGMALHMVLGVEGK